jgi:hypothetical protein
MASGVKTLVLIGDSMLIVMTHQTWSQFNTLQVTPAK